MFEDLVSFVSESWDVAHGKGPALVPEEVGRPPSPQGAYGQAGLYRDARTRALAGGAVKVGTGEGEPGLGRPPQGASGELGLGHFVDTAGDQAYGVWAEGQVAKSSGDLLAGPHHYLGYEASLADGSIGVKTTAKAAQVSAQASGPTLSVVGGTRGTNTDTYAKAGVSPLGPGAGVRFLYGDDDGDQLPEYGLGLDLEWFSGDFKTEDPLGALLRCLPGSFEPLGEPTNHTQAVKDLFRGFTD